MGAFGERPAEPCPRSGLYRRPHTLDWGRSSTGDLGSTGRHLMPDRAITVTLIRCQYCDNALLLLGPETDESSYRVVLEVDGADIPAR
jgi:hypothetical protein